MICQNSTRFVAAIAPQSWQQEGFLGGEFEAVFKRISCESFIERSSWVLLFSRTRFRLQTSVHGGCDRRSLLPFAFPPIIRPRRIHQRGWSTVAASGSPTGSQTGRLWPR